MCSKGEFVEQSALAASFFGSKDEFVANRLNRNTTTTNTGVCGPAVKAVCTTKLTFELKVRHWCMWSSR
jgi:hypothetical protein